VFCGVYKGRKDRSLRVKTGCCSSTGGGSGEEILSTTTISGSGSSSSNKETFRAVEFEIGTFSG